MGQNQVTFPLRKKSEDHNIILMPKKKKMQKVPTRLVKDVVKAKKKKLPV